jgi:hypothetical protein
VPDTYDGRCLSMTQRLFAKLFFTFCAIAPFPSVESIDRGRYLWFLALSLLLVWLESIWMPIFVRLLAIFKARLK